MGPMSPMGPQGKKQKKLMDDRIKLAHGSGRGLTEILSEVILPNLYPQGVPPLEDATILPSEEGKMAFTTDSFVVHPLIFPGGDIGKLAACGTINDLAMMGAIPRYMSVALILEEGLQTQILSQVLASLRRVCEEAKVEISCGDTKVVEKGKADGIFINTSGLGIIPKGRNLSVTNLKEGDAVLVSGFLGLHGITILSQRQNLQFASQAISDCAPLHDIVETLLRAVPETKALRDATRGGCAAVLNEMAEASGVTIVVEEKAIPVSDVVKGACSYLGMEALQIANEGHFVAVVPAHKAPDALQALGSHPLGQGASILGSVTAKARFPVWMKTLVGGKRVVEVPPGELLPRIC